MSAPGRPMPPLGDILRETNDLLAAHRLPTCESVEPCEDPDSWNWVVFGCADGVRKYAIKINIRHPDSLYGQRTIANAVRKASGLPIPVHYCCSQNSNGLALMVMEYMPGEQLRTALPRLEPTLATSVAEDLGKCLGRFHRTDLLEENQRLVAIPVDTRALVHGWMAWCTETAARSSVRFDSHEDWDAVKEGSMSAAQLLAGRSWLVEQRERLRETLDRYMASARDEPVEVALMKGDQDVREFLCQVSGVPHISAMLDWERVLYGDPRYEVMVLCHRLRLMELDHLWADMRAGYEKETGRSLCRSAGAMIYLLFRAMGSVVRGPRPDISIDIIKDILIHEWTPFDAVSR
ncbi:MAG: aminoglycoside phosphotransferase family protein [Lentisphaerae bacterium]|jgi:aminoglycoside phosphotransferase (APT) family kinase protein|nr:aminoglycoside phosphotransferase family protein [Lentisphaerota bacterium]